VVCTLANGWTETLMLSVRSGPVWLFSATILFLLCTSGNAQETQVVAGQAIQVKVARVNVGVVVTDDKGKFVEGLHRDAFHVFDTARNSP